MKARIQLSEGDNGGGDEVIEVDTAEVIDERCGHVVIDPKDDNKCAECREQYKEWDCNEWLECPMCTQWYHNEECFLQRYCTSTFLKPNFVTDFSYNLFISSCQTYLLYPSPPLSLIQAIVKKP